MPEHQVFVSHTKEESALAQRLKMTLADDFGGRIGFYVSSDHETLQAGDRWLDGLQAALNDADCVLVLCSDVSVGKPWVNFEAGAGWIRNTRVIPVCHSGMTVDALPVPLCMLQAIEIADAGGLERLYRTFSETMGLPMPERDFAALGDALARAAEDISHPEQSGNYRLIETIKLGDTSDVLMAMDEVLNRRVVKKVLKRPEQAGEFRENAQAASVLSNLPNFISVYSAGFGGGERPHIIMQHMAKGNLSKHIRAHREAELDLEYARRVVYRIGGAMYEAHNRNVAIGNLKSTNILLDDDYEPYLSPRTRNTFLKAFELRNAVSERLVTLEDLTYTAPEILTRGGARNVPYELSDQYSLGILAYELCTGRLPETLPLDVSLPETEQLEWACQLIERRGDGAFVELPALKVLRRDVPGHISSIIARMVSLEPEERYPRMDIALGALRSAEHVVVEDARESYVRCLNNPREPGFFECFYDTFTGRGDIGQRFGGFDRDRWTRQHGKLRHALDASFSFVRNYIPNVEVPEPNALTRTARSHGAAGMGIRPDEYRHFVDALVSTVCGDDERAPFDPECEDADRRDEIAIAWRELMKPVVRYFQRKSRSGG